MDFIPLNASLDTVFNFSDRITMVPRFLHPLNAAKPMETVLFPMLAFFKLVHPQKALSDIEVTDDGMEMDVSFVQPLNAR